ncbi:hypothetical protein DIPPA_11005 [Diplonema papillatum]|nr:hypothetical protein DIPPA_11005 [Diplonema papillatum]
MAEGVTAGRSASLSPPPPPDGGCPPPEVEEPRVSPIRFIPVSTATDPLLLPPLSDERREEEAAAATRFVRVPEPRRANSAGFGLSPLSPVRGSEVQQWLLSNRLDALSGVLSAAGYDDLPDLHELIETSVAHEDQQLAVASDRRTPSLLETIVPAPGHRAKLRRLLSSRCHTVSWSSTQQQQQLVEIIGGARSEEVLWEPSRRWSPGGFKPPDAQAELRSGKRGGEELRRPEASGPPAPAQSNAPAQRVDVTNKPAHQVGLTSTSAQQMNVTNASAQQVGVTNKPAPQMNVTNKSAHQVDVTNKPAHQVGVSNTPARQVDVTTTTLPGGVLVQPPPPSGGGRQAAGSEPRRPKPQLAVKYPYAATPSRGLPAAPPVAAVEHPSPQPSIVNKQLVSPLPGPAETPSYVHPSLRHPTADHSLQGGQAFDHSGQGGQAFATRKPSLNPQHPAPVHSVSTDVASQQRGNASPASSDELIVERVVAVSRRTVATATERKARGRDPSPLRGRCRPPSASPVPALPRVASRGRLPLSPSDGAGSSRARSASKDASFSGSAVLLNYADISHMQRGLVSLRKWDENLIDSERVLLLGGVPVRVGESLTFLKATPKSFEIDGHGTFRSADVDSFVAVTKRLSYTLNFSDADPITFTCLTAEHFELISKAYSIITHADPTVL